MKRKLNLLSLPLVALMALGTSMFAATSPVFAQAVPFSPETLESLEEAVAAQAAAGASQFIPLPSGVGSPNVNPVVATSSISGKDLFEKVWKPGKPLHDGADGIGPMFNERSCVACHSQAGVGGGGGIDKNVDILSISNRVTRTQQMRLANYHPGFRSTTGGFLGNIVLHRFGLDSNFSNDEYSKKRTKLLRNYVSIDSSEMDPKRLQRKLETNPRPTVIVEGDIPLLHTQRNSTALFGAGLIDSIPGSAIVEEALRQEKAGKVSGRPAQLRDTASRGLRVMTVGKFGWRAQQATLADFVEGACAVELGLDTQSQRQAIDPRKPNYRASKADLTRPEIMALTSFVASLKKPRESDAKSTNHAIVDRGRMMFESVGCADCHLPKLADVEGIYSDLLLHDMGKSLADPAPARDALERQTKVFFQLISDQEENPARMRMSFTTSDGVALNNYYGFESESANPIVDLATREKEWRTPPLWGVADSAPYMHDGRARTMAEAIAYHDGESKSSKIKFFKLPSADQKALLAFLGDLRAPENN